MLRGEMMEMKLLLSGGSAVTAFDVNGTGAQIQIGAGVAGFANATSDPAATTAATSFTFAGPGSVPFSYTSGNYTITPNGVFTGSITIYTGAYAVYIAPAVGTAAEGQVILTWNNSSAPQTFTIQQRDAWNPDSSGNMNITLNATANGALTDPASLPVVITPRPVELTRPYSEETYQQSGGRADIVVTGSWTTTNGESPTALEAQWNNGPWTTIWTNSTNATGSAVPFTGTLPSQADGAGTFTIRWANDHAMTETEVNVTVGDVDTNPGQAPILPATFSTQYQLPTGGTVWNIGTTAPGVGNSAAFQYALHNSKLGDVIVLTAGATYTAESLAANGNGSSNDITSFRLEPKSGTGWVYITTSDYSQLPAPGTRIDPSDLGAMATIKSAGGPNGFSALTSVGAANNYRFVGVEFLATDTCYNLIWLGQTASSWDANIYSSSWAPATDTNQLPHDIVFDRCIVHQTSPDKQLQCGILMNGSNIAVIDSYIAGAQSTAEANDIFCWNGPGPFQIVNNYLEATASEIIFGANDPSVVTSNGAPYQLVPSDIVVENNLFEKLAIHNPNDPSYDGNPWLIKNQFEIKSAQRVLLSGNVMDYDNGIAAGQQATAIVLTPRNSNGDAPYSVCQDITITNNVVHGAGQVFNITGPDVHDMWLYSGTLPTRRISITNNIFDGISDFFKFPAYPGVNTSFATFNVTARDDGGPIDLTVSHNTWLFGPNLDPLNATFNLSTGVVTVPNNGLIDGQKIMFSGNLPTGLTAGVTYWAHVIDANTFTVWGSVAYTGSNAYYVFPLQFSNQITFSGSYAGGGQLDERFGYYSFDWQSGSGLPMTGAINFHFDNNIIDLGNYGVIIEDSTYGTPGMDQIFQNYTFQGNVLIGDYNGVDYDTRGSVPNQNAPTAAAVGFTDYANRNYLLAPTSPYKNDGSDGTDPGVNWAVVSSATQYTISGNPSGSVVTGHAPSGASKTITTLEDTAYTFSAADFGFSDPLDSPPNNFVAVKITTLPGAGSLTDNGTALSVGQYVPIADVTAGKLKFTPAANSSGQAYTRFTFQVQDDGSLANGGANLDPTPKTITLNVTAVNDPPTGVSKTVATLQGTAYTFALTDFGFSDPKDSPPNNFLAVKITTLPPVGLLTDNGTAVTAGQFIPVGDISSGKLKFTPAAGASGTPYTSFTFQVEDDGGTANGGSNLDPTAKTLTVNVTFTNHPPVGTNSTVTTLEDTPYVFALADFGFSDPNDTPPNNFLAVKITTLPTAGALTDGGVAISAGQFILAGDITSGKLKFTPAANANGVAYSRFTFQVADDGGGTNLDPSPKTLTINVTSVNDSPVGTSTTVTAPNRGGYTFTTADFGFSDPNDSPPNNFWAVLITTLPTAGTLSDKGAPVTAGQLVMVTDITAGALKFTPAAGGGGSPYASFKFQVADDGGHSNGGSTTDPNPKTMTINVHAANDPPTGTSTTVGTFQDIPYTFATADFGFSDPLDTPPNNFWGVIIDTTPTAGVLSDNGVAVTRGQLILIGDITGGKLKFVPATGAMALPYASFTFQVADDGGNANGGSALDPSPKTMTINVSPVNGLAISEIASNWLTTGPNGDFNGDGIVNGLDIVFITSRWPTANTSNGSGGGNGPGTTNVLINGLAVSLVSSHWLESSSVGDFNSDGTVNGLDLVYIASHWLQTVSVPTTVLSAASSASTVASNSQALPAIDQSAAIDQNSTLAQVAADWLSTQSAADLNHDGVVNGLDIALIASRWQQPSSAASSLTAQLMAGSSAKKN